MSPAPVELSIVVPFFNEERAVAGFFARLLPVLGGLGLRYEIVAVNDGSADGTLAALLAQRAQEPALVVLDLSRNFGKEAAMTAGLDHAAGAATVVLDADLQDPPELIPQLVTQWRAGSEVVLARRANRATDTVAKRASAGLFYRLFNRLSETPIPENVGDMRLLDRAVVDALRRLPERQRFMKGLFAWVGFRTTTVDFVREPRAAGASKFSFWPLWNLALQGITSFSTLPLRVWTWIGLLVALLSFVYASFLVVRTLVDGIDVPGYASTLVIVLFLGGLQLMGIGLLGEYLGRTYLEAKQRPVYVVRALHR